MSLALNYQVLETFYVNAQTAFGAMLWVRDNCGYESDKEMTFDADNYFHPMQCGSRFMTAELHEASNTWRVEVLKIEHPA